ncbi:hypothetical protein [Rhizobium rhizogenes]|uniref:Uncharacterized protein n=1 Tax=Rhizobium rhizogenes (strain K84 / ATCC BAA-868) TaxID=311403 RepID=B9JAV6_RHIR8|nr:hypothetical protein [Rhizobium rhizogenes]ACM25789.1 hypothetical protein Arad_1323 [Rhizobium rhizogenes K84]NTG06485.1 hypothetical protein [Rhizobium rhizogenes]
MSKFVHLPEETIERVTDYITAGAYRLRSRHGFRIPAIVAGDWAEQGYSILKTNALARQYGVQRKTMWSTIKGCIDAGFIREIGRTEDGRAMYVPCLERGDEWHAAKTERANEAA